MGLNTPAALGLLALAIPLIIFYMLRLRRQLRPVSSLLLWQRVLQDRQANAPWQKLQRNLLLLLQLILLTLLVLALTRPYFTVEARVQGNVVILLDGSASMQATDILPSRFDSARTQAKRLIRTLSPADSVTLILVTASPQPLLTTTAANRIDLDSALDAAQPAAAPADWTPALALASAAAATQPNTTVVILSDGAIPPNLPTLPAPVQWIPVGKSGNNQAIVALSTREGKTGPELFTRLMNVADQPAATRLELYADGTLFAARTVQLEAYPHGDSALTFTNLPANATLIEARLSTPDDLLLDNTAQTRRAILGGQTLLVGPGNLFLERALGLLPGLSVAQTTPDTPLPEGTFNLYIFDRAVPAALPLEDAALLFIAPPQSTALFSVPGVFTTTQPIAPAAADHPVLAFTDFSQLHVAQAQTVSAPAWSTTLLNSPGGPLLWVGQTGNRRVAVLAFNLLKSDLPLQIDFPILITNLTRWLLDRPPVDDSSTIKSPAAANPLDPAESNIRPNQAQIYSSTSANPVAALPGQQSLWWVAAALAIPLLVAEWWVYWRGGGA